MKRTSLKYIVIAVFLHINCFLSGQNIPEKGAPFIKNYTPAEYGYSSQTWAVAKDNCGVMYFGCNDGVLEFDGVHWRLIETKLKSHVRSLASDSSGLVYVGASNDFGYLGIDQLGSKKYYSLLEEVHIKDIEFSDVWSIHTTTHGVYFFTIEKIFRWYNDTITTIPVKTELFASVVNDQVYVLLAGGGIGVVKADKVSPLPYTQEIGKDASGLVKILPYSDNKLLFVTDLNTQENQSEFFVYHLDLLSQKDKWSKIPSSILMPIKTEVDRFINENYLYDAERIDEHNYALGTSNGGIVIMNKKGEFIRIINSNRGLQNNSVHDLLIDENKNIWASLNKGISFIDINSGISLYNDHYGLKEVVISIFEFKDNIYLGSFDGIYNFSDYVLKLRDDYYTLNKIENYGAYCFDMISLSGNLFAAGNGGILQIVDKKAQLKVEIPRLTCFAQSSKHRNRLFLGLYPGFAYVDYTIKVDKENNEAVYEVAFSEVNVIQDIYESILKMVTDRNGDIWLVTAAKGLIRFQPDKNDKNDYSIHRYGTESGLSQLSNIQLFNIDNELVACLADGVYKAVYDSSGTANKNIRFEREMSFGSYFNNDLSDVTFIVPDNHHNLWIGSQDRGIVFLQSNVDGSWEYIDKPFKKISTSGLNDMYIDSNNFLWISTIEGVFRINTDSVSTSNNTFHSIIRKVTASDSVLFKGAFYDIKSKRVNHYTKRTCVQPSTLKYELGHSYNSVKFNYTAMFYENADKNQYQYFLEGFDKKWSSPTFKTEKEYTNLPEGEYCFRIKSTNIYNSNSREGSFYFTVLPPWYRTLWAYIFYAAMGIILIILVVRIYTFRLKSLNKRLEEIIRDRTKEIQKQKDELQIANATKDKFFGIIAHDLRNPFNTILGFSHIILNKIKNKDYKNALTFATFIHQTSEKAYELLENLLTWSRSQSGQVEFHPELINIKDIVDSNVFLLIEFAKKKGISISSALKEDIVVFIDKNMILTVLRNLITNAIKFSKEGGHITIRVEEFESEIIVHVIDTGVGMEEKVISKLFKIGESVKTEGTEHEQGTGLGLLLCKEFVEWNKGKIWVKSKPGDGSTFSFTLPKKAHAKELKE